MKVRGLASSWRKTGAVCGLVLLSGCLDLGDDGAAPIWFGVGSIDGETELGPDHRAPGYLFHYVIDVSDGNYSRHAIRRGIEVFNERTSLEPSDPDFIDMSLRPTIAILLPSRTESRVIGINRGPNYGPHERANMNVANRIFNVHFIGPWCADAADSKVDAMVKVRDDDPSLDWRYSMTCKDANNNALIGLGGGSTLLVDVDDDNHAGAFHFWCMNIEGSGRSIIDIGTSSGNVDFSKVTGENDVHMHLVRLHQDNIQFTPDNHPFWGVSSWHTRFHLHGFYSDLPWNSEHHFYLREEPYGDMMYEYVFCDRSGGQIMQKADRSLASGNSPIAPLRGTRTDPGTNYYRHFHGVTRTGRWASKASSFFTQFSSHQGMDFEDCVVVAREIDNCRSVWPPPNPYGAINDEPYNFTVGGTSWTHFGNGSGGPQSSSAPHPGYLIGPIRMRNCVWYSKRPTKDLLGFRSTPRVDVEDCGFFCDAPIAPVWDTGGYYAPGSRAIIGIGTEGRGGIFAAANLVGSFRWVGNCQPSHISVLTSPPFNIPANEIVVPTVKVGENRVTIGNADQDITFDRFSGTNYQAGVDPAALVVQ